MKGVIVKQTYGEVEVQNFGKLSGSRGQGLKTDNTGQTIKLIPKQERPKRNIAYQGCHQYFYGDSF